MIEAQFNWDEHFKDGGRSGGVGDSAKQQREQIHQILSKYYIRDTDSIIDIACGDLLFWDYVSPKHYTGTDISQHIISKNKIRFPGSSFIHADSSIPLDISADVVLCLDMLYHVLGDTEYIQTVNNLASYSKKYLIITTFGKNPFDTGMLNRWLQGLVFVRKGKNPFQITETTNGVDKKYRDFEKIALPILASDFKLVEKVDMGYRSLYVFKRV